MYNTTGMAITEQSRSTPWLLLVFSLARKGASLRVSVWRKLQRYGSLPLGNSGYLLPNNPANHERFEWLATTIRSGGGDASVVEVLSIDNWADPQLIKRFADARGSDYRDILQQLRRNPRAGLRRETARIKGLRDRFQEIVSIDFFGSPLKERVERALNAATHPQEVLGMVKVSPTAYRKKVWVTRPRPGIDRVTSAWLIRNFIDPKARFTFASEDKKPKHAVPFDMYEGGFGHRGEDCTFETLTKAFRIRDKAVSILSQIVHDADLLDEKYGRKEGFGLDEVMKGWARQRLSDAELLKRGIDLTEALYQALR